MRHLLVSSLLLLSITACAGPSDSSTIALTFDPCDRLAVVPADDATAAELDSLTDALAMWNAIAGTQLEVVAVEPAAATATAVGPSVRLRFDEAASAFHGIYLDQTGEIVINRALTDRHECAVTMAHELGHAFGLVHVSDRSSVMNKGNLKVEPNGADAAEIVGLWSTCAAPAVVR